MTRARWLTGAIIGAASLIVAGEALLTYVHERLIVGVVAVVVLMAVTAIGFASLGRARRYIARELAALDATPPSGALYGARRAQLLLLRQRGVSPDLELLEAATAAAEAERGYTGRYLVATTVLIGLVGTFGGLMETLARATPLLKADASLGADGPTAALALIAGPLAGLHVTFGTSVVAILVTLALTLIQGDVTLHQERLLALLQERTRHVLLPELWPADESAAERTVRALHDLRASVGESLAKSAAITAEKIAGVVRVEVQRLVTQVHAETQTASAAQTAALDRTGAVLTEGFRRTADQMALELRDAAVISRDAMTAAATAARDAMTAAATTSSDAMTAAATTAREAMTAAASASRETLAEAAKASREAVAAAASATGEAVAAAAEASREVVALAASASQEAFEAAARATRDETVTAVATLASTTAQTAESTAASTQAAVAALGELRAALSAQLQGASQSLASAATELRGAVGVLSPSLAELAPQLGGLTAEIALLAARVTDPEQSNAVLDELVRLSEDVERLLASGQPAPETLDVAPRETGS